jgi:hypothetical protein
VALDLLRGIWNLAITFRRFRKSIPTRGPVNDIVLGPVQTLHQPNGTPAGNVYWYQPSYRQAVRPADLSGKMQGLRSFELRVRSRLRGAKDGELLSRALVRYARAQDEPDLENVFLSLWSLLETLTDTLKTSYDYTIRRAAFLWKDQGLALQELRHLRLWRNRTVHRGESSEERETHVYQLKMYVDALLAFLLLDPNNRNKAFSEIAQFLDLPHDTGALRKMIAVYQRGLKLRARIR